MINAQMPYRGVALKGFQSVSSKKWDNGTRVKKVIVSVSNVITIPSVVKMDIVAMIAKIIGMILALRDAPV
ncbi:hypothetical protein A6M57_5670 [Staphylococcus pseudintermedius]|nr:hypothetical protein A6M57_5670 [Staphylococcus pseudintermedius]